MGTNSFHLEKMESTVKKDNPLYWYWCYYYNCQLLLGYLGKYATIQGINQIEPTFVFSSFPRLCTLQEIGTHEKRPHSLAVDYSHFLPNNVIFTGKASYSKLSW